MTEAERPIQRSYKDLNSVEKVHAILASVKEPVSRTLALDFSGIKYADLPEEEQLKVDAVFTQDSVDSLEVEGESRYQLKAEAKHELEDQVDMKSVHKQISEKLLGDLGLDL